MFFFSLLFFFGGGGKVLKQLSKTLSSEALEKPLVANILNLVENQPCGVAPSHRALSKAVCCSALEEDLGDGELVALWSIRESFLWFLGSHPKLLQEVFSGVMFDSSPIES